MSLPEEGDQAREGDEGGDRSLLLRSQTEVRCSRGQRKVRMLGPLREIMSAALRV